MAVKSRKYALPDTYLKLVQQFPLVRIRDDDHLDAAQQIIDRLLKRELDTGEQEYLDALTDFVELYENENVDIPDASEADVLRELMSANGLNQPKLAKAIGISQSTISAVLTGDRSLTKEHIVKLSRFFQVPAAVFLPG